MVGLGHSLHHLGYISAVFGDFYARVSWQIVFGNGQILDKVLVIGNFMIVPT